MSELTQDKRIGSFTTPLGKDALVLVRFEGSEGLSELFEYQFEALSKRENIDFDDAIGRGCSLSLTTYGGERFFNGVLVEAQWLGVKSSHYAYRLVLRPWLWLLSRTSDCRIFQGQTAPDIIKKVFSDRGFNDFRMPLTENYPKLEYCVQYRETDLAFVSRLMEQHGIYYFFEHTSDQHMLVLADSKLSHRPIPGHDTVPFIALAGQDRSDREHIYEWLSQRRFRTGKVELNDYDFHKPNADLTADAKGSEHYTRSNMELYDYPGKYDQRGDGEKYAKVCLESQQALDHRRYGTGDAVSLLPGGLVKLEKHSTSSENTQYLVVRAQHSFVAEFYRSGAAGSPERIYFGHYEFLGSDRVFRGPIVTPKPLIHGIQTAKVVGKDGEEIDVDEYGRIKVEFFWDRKKTQSCRIRCAQVWSGKQWGGQFIPRIGMEVVVEFLEGDPDRPLVVGAVYNEDNKLPYELPANKTQSGVKSDSSKGHGGYNELMFEDKKNAEFVRFHAERNLDSVIEAAETRSVGSNQTLTVGHDQTETIQHDRSVKILNNDTLVVMSNQIDAILSNRTSTIFANETLTANMITNLAVAGPIILTCGASSIMITPGSIIITSPSLIINAATVINGALVVNGAGVINGLPII